MSLNYYVFFYRVFAIIFWPFYSLYFLYKSIKEKELHRFFERLGFSGIKNVKSRYIWIHCASVGEVNSVVSFAKYLKERNEGLEVLITTVTFSGARIAISHGFLHQYAPLDVPFIIKKFLNTWKPEMVFFVDSEIWPNMVLVLDKKKIPSVLLNARLSKKSFERWKYFKIFAKFLLSKYTLILPQSSLEFSNYSFLGTDNIIEINNLKYSIPPKRYDYQKLDRIIFIAASTHNGEESIIIDAHKFLKKKYEKLLTIIVPRHPNRLQEILKLCDGMKTQVRTESGDINLETEIYIVNTFGEMDFFYSISDIAFVGGSLVDVGGHNIFEAAVQRCAIIHGNYMDNFFDMSQYFATTTYQISSLDELIDVLDGLMSDINTLEYIKNRTYELSKELNNNVVSSVYKLVHDKVKESKILV